MPTIDFGLRTQFITPLPVLLNLYVNPIFIQIVGNRTGARARSTYHRNLSCPIWRAVHLFGYLAATGFRPVYAKM